MRRIYAVLLAGLFGSTALAATAVPPGAVPAPHAASSADASRLPAEAKTAAADPLASLFPGQKTCLCAVGYYCCTTLSGSQRCVPNGQLCL